MSLADVLLATASPDAVALVGERGSTTYARLTDDAARLGGALVARGVVPGDRIAIASAEDEAFVTAYLAVLHVGAIAVPVNPSAPPRELERELTTVTPRLALGAGAAREVLEAVEAEVMAIELDALGADPVPRVARADADVAVLLFTSGTAGAPKAAMLTHGNLAANIRQVLDHPGLRLHADDRMLGALPFHHVFGLNVALGVALAAGATIVLAGRFDAAATARLVAARGVTVLAGVPTMYVAWLELGEHAASAETFASVRLAVSGAASLPAEVGTRFRERFGVVVHQGYGLTEASPIVTTTALHDDAEPRPGSIGPPLPGVEVRVVDVDGTDVLAGDPGELWVRGPNVFAGYWHDQEATARVLTPEGWLRTGDVAVIEGDDLHLVDRVKDLVIVSGFNVYPVEVEDVLRAEPHVRDAAVVGEPHPRTGETVVAYVVPEPGHAPDIAALGAACARALARYKCPSRIEIVDEIPRSVAGKLVRRELRVTSSPPVAGGSAAPRP